MTPRHKTAPVLALTVLLLVPAALLGQANKPIGSATTAEQAVATGSNAFALDLYQRLKEADGNLFCSPYSLSTALAMTYAGARNETAEQMAAVMHFPAQQDRLHEAMSRMIAMLNAMGRSKGFELSVANALWGDIRWHFEPPFLSVIQRYYSGKLTSLDFQRPAEAVEQINRWTADRTHGKVDKLLSADDLAGKDPTALVLTNAIYFKGEWLSKFDQNSTKDRPFWTGPSQQVMVATMDQTASLRINCRQFNRAVATERGWSCSLLELPYEGGSLSMIILLPEPQGRPRPNHNTLPTAASVWANGNPMAPLQSLENAINLPDLKRWIDQLRQRNPIQVQVVLPKFKLRWHAELKPVLSAMGMANAFLPRLADFSGIARQPSGVYLNSVVHEAFVDVNEEGTEAGAVTAVGACGGAGSSTPPALFLVDHPFLFVIRDNGSGAILFVGRVVNPLAVP